MRRRAALYRSVSASLTLAVAATLLCLAGCPSYYCPAPGAIWRVEVRWEGLTDIIDLSRDHTILEVGGRRAVIAHLAEWSTGQPGTALDREVTWHVWPEGIVEVTPAAPRTDHHGNVAAEVHALAPGEAVVNVSVTYQSWEVWSDQPATVTVE
jgi:hypothetical protein